MSPLDEKPCPRKPETTKSGLRERIRISVLPKVPAARTTWRARISNGAVRPGCMPVSVGMNSTDQRGAPGPTPSTGTTFSTVAPQCSSAPCRYARAR